MSQNPTRSRTGLVDELQRSHRAVVATLSGMLVLNLMSSAYLLVVSQSRVDLYTEIARQLRLTHEAMLSEQTDLRDWLATGDRAFLTPFNDDRQQTETASAELIRQSAVDPAVVAEVVGMMRAVDLWHAWADRTVGEQRSTGALSPVLLEDKTGWPARSRGA